MQSFILPFLAAISGMPPKESGNWIDPVFDRCVELLLNLAALMPASKLESKFLFLWRCLDGPSLEQECRFHPERRD